MNDFLQKHLRYNFSVNVLDGGFFGMALGFSSFVTILPLFVSHMTDSALLIGLIPAIRGTGWQLPQLFVADHVRRANRYWPIVVVLTSLERFPFLGFAIVALALPILGNSAAMILTFTLLIVQSLGAGVTSPAWQSMIARVIPPERRGTFFGTQSSAANVMASLGAVVAGVILDQIGLALNFAICFFIAFLAALASWYCLALTREPSIPSPHTDSQPHAFREELWTILRCDKNFRWYLVSRMLYQVATMGFAFYTVYAVRYHNVGVVEIGVMTSVFMGAQIIANPVMGWLGDRTSHRLLLEAGAVAALISALFAAWAANAGWFYLIFILAGIANVAAWTITITMTIDFAPDPSKRPVYVGLSNTLVAPAAIIAPLFGGWLADAAGYSATFVASALGGLIAWIVLRALVRDPKK